MEVSPVLRDAQPRWDKAPVLLELDPRSHGELQHFSGEAGEYPSRGLAWEPG